MKKQRRLSKARRTKARVRGNGTVGFHSSITNESVLKIGVIQTTFHCSSQDLLPWGFGITLFSECATISNFQCVIIKIFNFIFKKGPFF